MKNLCATLAAVTIITAMSVASARAQSVAEAEPPRTLGGRPDFTGAWHSRGLTMMERQAPGPLVVDDEGAAIVAGRIYDRLRSAEMDAEVDPEAIVSDVRELGKVGGEWRTSFVTTPENGKLPVTDKAEELMRSNVARFRSSDGPESRNFFERCLLGTGSAPLSQVPSNNVRSIVQTDDHLAIYTEEGGDLRVVRIEPQAGSGQNWSRYGDSVGTWDGDALIVETRGSQPRTPNFPWARVFIDEGSVVHEEFELLAPDELRYRFTVEDETLYSEPWSAEFSLFRSDLQAYEYACHEGNYSMVNILKAARVTER